MTSPDPVAREALARWLCCGRRKHGCLDESLGNRDPGECPGWDLRCASVNELAIADAVGAAVRAAVEADHAQSIRGPAMSAPCPAWLPLAGGALDKVAGVPVRHLCVWDEGHAGPHRCEDCDEEWT